MASGGDGAAPLGKCLFKIIIILQLFLGSQGTQQQQLLLHKQPCVGIFWGAPRERRQSERFPMRRVAGRRGRG